MIGKFSRVDPRQGGNQLLGAFAGLIGRTRRLGGGDRFVAGDLAVIFGGPQASPIGGR